MNLQQLKYFICVTKNMSFTKASQQLFVAQSALSRSISQLEEEFDTKLFVRSRDGLRLTQTGQILYEESLKLMDQVDEIYRKVEQANVGQSQHLRVGFLDLLLNNCFQEFMVPFLVDHRDIAVSLERDGYRFMYQELLCSDYFDLIFTRDFIRNLEENQSPDIGYMELLHDDMAVLVPSDHKYAFLDSTNDLSLFQDDVMLMLDQQISGTAIQYFRQTSEMNGLTIKTPVTVQCADVMLAQISAGLGISIFPYCCGWFNDVEGVKFIRIDSDQYTANIGISWNKNNPNPALHQFLDYLRHTSYF